MDDAAPRPTSVPAHAPAELVFPFDFLPGARITEHVQGSAAAALRDAPDVLFTPGNGGRWIAHRRETLAEIMAAPECFSARQAKVPADPFPPLLIPATVDPSASLPYRRAMLPAFSKEAIAVLDLRIRALAAGPRRYDADDRQGLARMATLARRLFGRESSGSSPGALVPREGLTFAEPCAPDARSSRRLCALPRRGRRRVKILLTPGRATHPRSVDLAPRHRRGRARCKRPLAGDGHR